MGIASFYLVIVVQFHSGMAATSVPMESLAICKAAEAAVKEDIGGAFRNVSTSCVKAAEL